MPFHAGSISRKVYAVTSSKDPKGRQIVRIRLNEYDNTPTHFWATFIEGLSKWNIHISLANQQKHFPHLPSNWDSFLQSFIEKAKCDPIIVIFERAHVITEPVVKKFLQNLLDHDDVSVVLLYDTHDEIEFKSKQNDDLRRERYYLTVEEEQKYYSQNISGFKEDMLSQARYFTDGWAASVKLVVHLVQKNGAEFFRQMEECLDEWLEQEFFSGYNQPELHRIIYLSMLDGFSLGLVGALANWSGESLEQIMEESPVIRYDEHKKIYHYGSYILPLIKKRQVLLTNRDKNDFYIRVADWYKECGNEVEAIKCYCRAGADKKVLEIMKCCKIPVSREVANCYVDTINEMPRQLIDENPLLLVILGYMLSTLNRYQDAAGLMEAFCKACDQGDDLTEELQSVLGEAYLLWGDACSNLAADEDILFHLFERAAELLPGGSSLLTAKLSLYSDCPAIRLKYPQRGVLQKHLAYIYKVEPYLRIATGGGYTGLGELAAAELNFYIRDFKNVEGHARNAINAALEREQYDIVCSACFLLMRFYFAKGSYEKTVEYLSLLKLYASEADYSTFFSMPDLAESWLSLKLGDRHQVAGWIREENQYQHRVMPWNYGRDRIIRAYYMLSNEQYAHLAAYADSSIQLLEKRSYHLLNTQLLMMKAVSLNELEEEVQAAEAFEMVYHWCHGNGIVMPVVEFGSYVRPLAETYRKLGRNKISDDWLEDIEKKATTYYVYQYNIRKQHERKQRKNPPLLEQLTEAELKLLLLLCRGMTAKEIAEVQGKTVNAVKGMIRRVYLKINANNVADAVRIAMEGNIEELLGEKSSET